MQEIMRIAYMLTSLGIGGGERQVVSLAERMEARGHKVLLTVLQRSAGHEWPTSVRVVYLVAVGWVARERICRYFEMNAKTAEREGLYSRLLEGAS